MTKIDLDVNNVYCVGDLHGNFNAINGLIKGALNMPQLTDCAIVFCGDIGFGFEKENYYQQILPKLEKLCKKNNVYCIFIRGNHDDPSYFDGKRINYTHIKAVQDYTVLSISNFDKDNILCVGGAISIDRRYRLKIAQENVDAYKVYHHDELSPEVEKYLRRGYWIDEPPVFDLEKISELKDMNITYVCTHTCPSFCYPFTKEGISYWINSDPELKGDIDNERQVMTNIKEALINDGHKLKKWVYGHYHRHYEDNIDGISYILLNMVVNGKFDCFELISY